uniref:ATP synthase complex subunit 8 n=1 Tax=Episcapha fortunii TaxID=2819887 RepID=A0A977LLD1_9CUCU|nr:ATP synthase F0 subunit 8 [Episcapha fortunii]UXF64387.1 ATP synthase F0 subunit 8 [Episcapha fortunii]
MPQMSPLSWLTLFIYFIMIFFMVNSLNYFSFMYPISMLKKKETFFQFNWKW